MYFVCADEQGVHLTAEGERLYTRVSAAMSLFQAAEDEMLEQAQLKRGSIVIGASETALSIYLPEKLSRFHSKYPGIQIKLYSYSTPQAVKAVKNGEVDLALVTTPVQAESPVKEIKLQKFAEKLIGGKNYSFFAKKRTEFERDRGISTDLSWKGYNDTSVLSGDIWKIRFEVKSGC